MNNIDPITDFFILYAIYILLPIIPTVVIYKLFPDVQMWVKGPLQGFTIRATGAAGGYVVCCLIGYFIVSTTMDSIKIAQSAKESVQQAEIRTKLANENVKDHVAWLVNAQIRVVDSDGSEVNPTEADNLISTLQPSITPPEIWRTEDEVKFYLPKSLFDAATISYTIPFWGQPVIIGKSDLEKGVIDSNEKIINLGVITLKKFHNNKYAFNMNSGKQQSLLGINSLPSHH